MGILDKIKSKFKKKAVNKIDGDSFIKTTVIYNSNTCFMVLINYSADYANELCSFIAACGMSNIRCRLSQIEYEEEISSPTDTENGESEFSIKPEKMLRQKYYCLCSGTPTKYAYIYNFIDYIGNSILATIEQDLFNNIVSSSFHTLINDNILMEDSFKYNYLHGPIYDNDTHGLIADLDIITSRLPKDIFSLKDIIELIPFDDSQYLSEIDKDYVYREFPNIDLKSINETPRYRYDVDYIGELDEDSIDDIFNQQYNRFNALDDVIYEDIDEVIHPLGGDEDDVDESM